jgi:radical SAM-linked protein
VKLRVKYTKLGSARFLSHLELMVAMERAFRRSKIPLAFTEGFNPHPKISYASALSVGIASEGEYLDIELTKKLDPDDFINAVNQKLISGIKILKTRELPLKSRSLTALVERAKYRVSCNLQEQININELQQIIKEYLLLPVIRIQRKTKRGLKEVDIRDGIYHLEGKTDKEGNLLINFIIATGSSGNIRPREVWNSLIDFTGAKLDGTPVIVREDLFTVIDGVLVSPIDLLVF